MSYVKSQTTIGSVNATVFQCQATNEYFYSLTSAAELVGKPPLSPFQFIQSKAFKLAHGKDFSPFQFSDDTGATYKLLSCNVVLEYLMHWCSKGDKLALSTVMALAKESLEIRAASAFSLTLTKVHEIQKGTDEALATQARREAREEHMAFQRSCWQLNFQPAATHDYLTILVFGTTATQAIRTPLTGYSDPVWTDDSVGINHHPDPLLMKLYRQVKKRCMSYTKGTAKERVDRAYLELTDQLMLG